jgi:hypothetical protein
MAGERGVHVKGSGGGGETARKSAWAGAKRKQLTSRIGMVKTR